MVQISKPAQVDPESVDVKQKASIQDKNLKVCRHIIEAETDQSGHENGNKIIYHLNRKKILKIMYRNGDSINIERIKIDYQDKLARLD